jgi:nitroreductase
MIAKILRAGICAPNGGNSQKWRFLVIKDRTIKQAVQGWYKKAFDEVIGPRYLNSEPPPSVTKERYLRQHSAVAISPITSTRRRSGSSPAWRTAPNPNRAAGSSIYPVLQNMVLATRALGLGTTLTTRHLLYERETEAALGLLPGVHSYAILPIGWPMGKFGPVGRGPLNDIVYQDRRGQPYAGV